ncbi:MAG: BatA domain-containing protein [Planctomycetota bacterium]
MMFTPSGLAIAFINPGLLWGLGLGAVPIIIHLLSRRYFRRVAWGATRFLLEAEKETRRRTKFEQWLLLALRCLAMLLLALLVTRPYLRPGLVAALLGTREQVARVVVLDDSASLAYRAGATLEFDRPRAAAIRLLSWMRQEAPRDPVTVYLTSMPTQPLVDNQILSEADLADLRERLQRHSPVNMSARPRRVLAELVARLTEANAVDVYILSDFQHSDWLKASAGESVFTPLRQLVESGKTQPRVILVASGLHPRHNVALLDTVLERPQTVAGFPAVVRVRAANHGSRRVADLVMRVAIDGNPLPAVPVGVLEARQEKEVALEVTFPVAGYHELALSIDPVDSFRADDIRRRAVHVKDDLAVLIVNGAPAADPYRDEVFLLRNALNPPGPLSSGIRVDVVDPEDIEATELATYDVVLLCNVAPPNAGARAVLKQYVQQGGGLAFFLGAEVGTPADYNQAFYADGSGLLPVALVELVVPTGATNSGVGLVRVGAHAVTAMFPADADVLTEQVHFWKYYRCVVPDADSAGQEATAPVVLAHFSDYAQTPALVERACGRGRVLLFTSSVDLDWNDWARAVDGSYVVTMLELIQYLARRGDHAGQVVAGETLRVQISPEEYEPGALVKSPVYPEEPAVPAVSERAPLSVQEDLTLEGPVATTLGTYVIDLTTRAGQVESRLVCVNLDAEESDLRVASDTELAGALVGLPHEMLIATDDFLRGTEQTRRELWPAILALLVTVLMLEQGLAWWFGTSRGQAARGSRTATQPGV